MSKGGRFAKGNKNAREQLKKQIEEQPVEQGGEQTKQKKQKKQSGGAARSLLIVAVLLVLVLGGVIGVTVYQATMDRMAANKPTVPTLPAETAPAVVTEASEALATEAAETVPATTELPYTPSGKDIINVLVIGDSSREDESAKLADTMILVTVNKVTKTVNLTSFLRDSYVDLPDYMGHPCGWNRINVAYNLGYNWGGQAGALEMTDMTLELNFGVEVDYNVVVDFDGFMNSINVLGEIPMELTQAEADYINKTLNKALGYEAYNYQEVYEDGSTYNYMGGWECLTYARMRKAAGDGDSDIKRSARQRKLITAVLNKVKDTNLDTLMEFAKEMMSQVVTDMTDDEILTCMWEILPLLPELKIEQQSIPAEGTSWAKELMVGDYLTYALEFDTKKNKEIMMNIAEADQLAATSAN